MQQVRFADGESYERFMGRWSRAAGNIFLDWLSLPAGLNWLDVGCGTGAFTETVQRRCSPAELVAIDPEATQVAYAQARAKGVLFEVQDACSLHFTNNRFDVAVSALVLNFIPDREKAVAEMRRVVRPGGTVAAYVWDFAGRRTNTQHLGFALMKVAGLGMPAALNAESATLENLGLLFERAGLSSVETRPIDIEVEHVDFDDYWISNTGFSSPMAQVIHSLDEEKRQQIKQMLWTILPKDESGRISFPARVNAVRGIVR